MKKWNLKVKSNPQEVVNKLDAALKSFGGFVFNMDQDKSDSIIFNFRKPIKYPDQILHRNRTIVNGKISETDTENETNLEISFTQHFFMVLTIFSVVLFGLVLITIIPRISSGPLMFILEGILVVLGIVLWIAIQKKFERDIMKYKALISKILEP